jgi:hypothetical protein
MPSSNRVNLVASRNYVLAPTATPAITQTWTAMIQCRPLPLLEPDQICRAAQHRHKAQGEPGDEHEGARVP